MISKDDLEHLKRLARLELGDEETKTITRDLGAILGYIDTLKEANVEGVSEMTHALDVKNITRDDEVTSETTLGGRDEIIAAFPEKNNDYLKVKAIL